jgi:hypothetical protein
LDFSLLPSITLLARKKNTKAQIVGRLLVQTQQLTAFSQCVSIRFSNEYFLSANVTGDGRRAWMVPERLFQVYYGRKKMGEIIDYGYSTE